MYKLTLNQFGEPSHMIKKVEEGVVHFIPNDPANTDYQKYLAWLAEGNTPEAADVTN